MLDTQHLLANKHIWKFCLGGAITVTILGTIAVTMQVTNGWNQYQFYLSQVQSGNQPGIEPVFAYAIFSSLDNLILIVCSIFFFASTFVIASILFRRYAPQQDTQAIIIQSGQSSQDDDDFQLEIVDLPQPPRH